MKTLELSNSKESNKTQKYIDLANTFFTEAKELFEQKKTFITKMALDHLFEHYQKCKNADCEYTAYINAQGCEVILNKMIIFKNTGKYE